MNIRRKLWKESNNSYDTSRRTRKPFIRFDWKIAKPGVPFGGKYRIIDFTLSNCSNSGIDTVGVLTQYEPHILNDHIGRGSPWDLDRMDGG